MNVQHRGFVRVVVAMAGGGRSTVAGGCGGSGCSGEREEKELQRRMRGEEEGFAKFEP